MKLGTLGIDLGKTVFSPGGAGFNRKVVIRKKCSRKQLLAFTANLEVELITDEQLDLQAQRRVRERWVMRRTAAVNQIRSLLLERGLTMPKGRSHVDVLLPRILEDAELKLSCSFRVLLAQLRVELDQLTARIEQMDTVIQQTAKENEACQRLTEIPGIGPVTATALIAAVGNASDFRKGRNLAAWMGIVPGEYSTGGKQKLLGISKRGNKYLRTLFVQGARSVVQQRHKQAPGLSSWIAQLLVRAHQNVVIVALANKLVRMAWAVLFKNERYRAPVLAVST
jgi:transposase